MDTIAEGSHVVLRKVEGGHVRVVSVTKDKLVVIEKVKLYLNNVIGEFYGSCFDVRNQQLYRAVVNSFGSNKEDSVDEEKSEASCDGGFEKDADVKEKQSGQAMSYGSLLALRASGASSKTIVSKLVEGSVTYEEKTAYAQDKYLRRKRRKHGDKVVVLRPSLRLLCDIYYKKDTEKSPALRLDFLAQMLTIANVYYGAKIVVVEQYQGLVTAGVLERLGGNGYCIHFHKGVQPQSIPAIDAMDFAEEIRACLYPVPLAYIFDWEEDQQKHMVRYFGEGDVKNSLDDEEDEKIGERRTKQEQRRKRLNEAVSILEKKVVQGLIIALKWTAPLPVLKELIKCLKSSSPVVIFCQYVQPLIDCYLYLKDQELAVNLRLSDSFFRYYQVLPDRTHPEMNQFVTSGFLLSGTSVIPQS